MLGPTKMMWYNNSVKQILLSVNGYESIFR